MAYDFDYAIVGGGLQAGLLALAIRAEQPGARVAIVEHGAALGGNHTWCFHAGDTGADMEWLEPLVVGRWAGYDVAFPAHRRTLASPYAYVTSERLDHCVRGVVDELWLGNPATEIGPHRVATASRAMTAVVVIDTRGPDHLPAGRSGWQTFVGREVHVPGHGLAHPMVMDATVEQRDAFTFMYVLPLAPDRLLIEDTAFADAPYLDVARGRQAISHYANLRGWDLREVVREETGILPLPLALDPALPTRSPLIAGYAGGWFHPVTGYSFPIAARLASIVAGLGPEALFGPELATHAAAHHAQLAFATRLNRMLFGWFQPRDRYHVLERFYRLPEARIRRFYALQQTAVDRARMFLGRPPRGLSWHAMLESLRPIARPEVPS
ncbi:MAG: lycopene beta-cyclase CrtY [Kofleriaceae bacterium]